MRAPILALLVAGGCSFAFVSGPPAHPSGPVSCTESRAVPIVDLGLTGAAVAGAIAGLASHNNCSASQTDCLPSDVGSGIAQDVGAALLVTSLVFALSTAHGFSETSACRRALSSSPVARAPS